MDSELTKGKVLTNIREFLIKLKMEYNAEYHIVFYTSMGRIVCDVEPPAAKSSVLGFVDDPTTFTVDISAIFERTDITDAHLINAKNVVIYKNDSDDVIMRVDQMMLFTDKILGFSLIRQQLR